MKLEFTMAFKFKQRSSYYLDNQLFLTIPSALLFPFPQTAESSLYVKSVMNTCIDTDKSIYDIFLHFFHYETVLPCQIIPCTLHSKDSCIPNRKDVHHSLKNRAIPIIKIYVVLDILGSCIQQ